MTSRVTKIIAKLALESRKVLGLETKIQIIGAVIIASFAAKIITVFSVKVISASATKTLRLSRY